MSPANSEIVEEKKQEMRVKNYQQLDDEIIEMMKQYFKVEDRHDVLIDYIKKNRIAHDVLTEP